MKFSSKQFAAAAAFTTAAAFGGAAAAQGHSGHGSTSQDQSKPMNHAMPMDHGKMGEMKGGGLSSLPSIDGEVRRVDKAAGKVTLRHGEIKQLEMPPMTMVFEVREKALLDTVKAGDKVIFKVVNEDGKMIVTELKPVN